MPFCKYLNGIWFVLSCQDYKNSKEQLLRRPCFNDRSSLPEVFFKLDRYFRRTKSYTDARGLQEFGKHMRSFLRWFNVISTSLTSNLRWNDVESTSCVASDLLPFFCVLFHHVCRHACCYLSLLFSLSTVKKIQRVHLNTWLYSNVSLNVFLNVGVFHLSCKSLKKLPNIWQFF